MNGKRILILGLGRAGRSLARYLLSRGAVVLAYDDNPKAFDHEDVRQLKQDQSFRVLSELTDIAVDFAIASPGITEESRAILALRRQHVRVIDEIEFGYEIVGKRIIAVTGTNGKSTTTTLIGEMLKADGRDSFYGGNLAPGLPFSSALLNGPKDLYVLEVSTFQLERCEHFAPKVALLLNIAEDHLNRHGSFERYQELKSSIFRNQTADDFAIVNQDDERVSAIRKSIRSRVMAFSLDDPKADAALMMGGAGVGGQGAGDWLCLQGKPVIAVRDVRLPGRHNIANALAAMLAAEVVNVKRESMIQVLTTFAGLEHRLELVREIAGVRYVNNSMCTNPAAAVQSLQAFDAPVVLITGGREKDLPIDDYLARIKVRAKATILVGENRVRLFDRLKEIGYSRMQVVETLAEAVREAQSEAEPGDVVLFSPGFASFDAYADFQERGRAFKDVVAELGIESASRTGCCATGVAR
jgi:UDP-N-acetylmuramoylalanine--D-glutamate ligase